MLMYGLLLHLAVSLLVARVGNLGCLALLLAVGEACVVPVIFLKPLRVGRD